MYVALFIFDCIAVFLCFGHMLSNDTIIFLTKKKNDK